MKWSLNTTFDQLAQRVGPDKVADDRARDGHLEDDQRQADAGEHGRGHHVRHRHRRLPGAPDRPGRRLRHARRTAAHPAGLLRRQGDRQRRHGGLPSTRSAASGRSTPRSPTTSPARSSRSRPSPASRCRRPRVGREDRDGRHRGIDATNGNSDAWMVGYTPQVSAAVWVGSGDSTHAIVSASGGPEYGRDLPGRAWKAFMDTYLAGQPEEEPHRQATDLRAGRDAGTEHVLGVGARVVLGFVVREHVPSPTFSISTGFSAPETSSSHARLPRRPRRRRRARRASPSTSPSSPSTSRTRTQACGGLLQPSCPTPVTGSPRARIGSRDATVATRDADERPSLPSHTDPTAARAADADRRAVRRARRRPVHGLVDAAARPARPDAA